MSIVAARRPVDTMPGDRKWRNGGALARTGEIKPSYRGEAGPLEGRIEGVGE